MADLSASKSTRLTLFHAESCILLHDETALHQLCAVHAFFLLCELKQIASVEKTSKTTGLTIPHAKSYLRLHDEGALCQPSSLWVVHTFLLLCKVKQIALGGKASKSTELAMIMFA
jgi:hypothetical protein